MSNETFVDAKALLLPYETLTRRWIRKRKVEVPNGMFQSALKIWKAFLLDGAIFRFCLSRMTKSMNVV